MSKVLFVIPRMGGGGAERVVANLANALSEDGYKVEITTFIKGESFYPLNKNVKLSDCGIKRVSKGVLRKLSLAFNFPKAYFKLKRKIKNGEYDAIISFLWEADLTLYLIKKSGVKFRWISSERADPARYGKLKKRILKKAYKRTDYFVCQTERVKDYYSYIDEDQKRVIFNPVSPDDLKEKTDKPEKNIVSVGRLSKQKNFQLLINAFAEIHGDFPEHVLTIYGEGGERENLERLIEEIGASDFVFLPGAVNDVADRISTAELFVLSSDYEGFPNALLEAAAMGIPCVSTDFSTGAAKEILPDRETVIPIGDKDTLKAVMIKMLSDKEFAENCGRNNRENCKRFYRENIVKEWERVIEGALTEK